MLWLIVVSNRISGTVMRHRFENLWQARKFKRERLEALALKNVTRNYRVEGPLPEMPPARVELPVGVDTVPLPLIRLVKPAGAM